MSTRKILEQLPVNIFKEKGMQLSTEGFNEIQKLEDLYARALWNHKTEERLMREEFLTVNVYGSSEEPIASVAVLKDSPLFQRLAECLVEVAKYEAFKLEREIREQLDKVGNLRGE